MVPEPINSDVGSREAKIPQNPTFLVPEPITMCNTVPLVAINFLKTFVDPKPRYNILPGLES